VIKLELLEILKYGFIQRAFIAGIFVAVLCSTLGIFLVLRRFSLIGDGLSHATFGGVAIGLFLNISPIYAAIPVSMLSSLIILKLVEKARVYGDAAIGIVSAIGISGGVVIASFAHGFNVDLFSYLFGNILAISNEEVFISISLSVIVILIIFFFYYDFFSVTFDEEFASISGINAKRINTILVLLTSLTVVLTMKVVGIMLVSALLILPAVTALQVARGFKTTIFVSSACAVTSVILGIIFSFLLNLPAGGTIVLINIILFSVAFLAKKLGKLIKTEKI
jgi:zinc transport system permease protein